MELVTAVWAALLAVGNSMFIVLCFVLAIGGAITVAVLEKKYPATDDESTGTDVGGTNERDVR